MNYNEARKLQTEMNLVFANGMDVDDVSNFFFDLLNRVNKIVNDKMIYKKKRKTRGVVPCKKCGSDDIHVGGQWVEDHGYRGNARCKGCNTFNTFVSTVEDNKWASDKLDDWYNTAKEARDAVKILWNKENSNG